MPSLHDVQHALRRSLLRGNDGAAVAWIVADGLAPGQRLSIYRNNVVDALTTALRLSFPAVHRLVGAAFFEGAAQVFVRERPPRSAWLDLYGADFADFLRHFPPAASLAYLPDVARLEWAVNLALHAPDAQALALDALAAVPPCDHDRVCFVPHPSLFTLSSEFPVDAIWRAVLQQDDQAMAQIDLSGGPVHLLVQRQESSVEVPRLGQGEWRYLADLCAGHPLGVVLHRSAGIDAPALLARHLVDGRFVGFRLAEPS
jgi:hypothetical protein